MSIPTPPSPLETPAVGTSTGDLIRPCDGPRVDRDPLPPPPREPPIAVALSGGGFRATLSGLGVLRFLADAGLLARVRRVSSVSGGSVANGVFACAYDRVAEGGFKGQAFDDAVLRPFVDEVSSRSLQDAMKRQAWKLIGPRSRVDLLAEEFDRRFFEGRLLEELPTPVRWMVNAANTSTGVRFVFERELLGDYVIGRVPTDGTGIRLSRGVAASAAVPGMLNPVVLRGIDFPCQRGRTVRLADGGVYDNMGLEPVDDLRDHLLVALNAGGLFVTGRYGRIPLIRDLQLAQSLLYRQSTALRRRWMVERFQAWEVARERGVEAPPWGRRGVLFGLATTFDPVDRWTGVNPQAPVPEEVAFIATSFEQFDREDCRRLIHAGWWLAGASLATYHPELLDDVPSWREPW